jgi:aminoglycoside 3-N-acetyltransferase
MLKLPNTIGNVPLFVHTDMMKVLNLLDRSSIEHSLLSFDKLVADLAEGRPLWIPTFTYRFCREGIYNVQGDPSEVGAFSEFFRKKANWTTKNPVFKVSGLNSDEYPLIDEPPLTTTIEAFGMNSIFAQLIKHDGIVVWLGASLKNSITTVHHAETMFGPVPYRYNKLFKGVMIDQGNEVPVSLLYHVKPMAFKLKYDYGIRLKAVEKGIIKSFSVNNKHCFYARAFDLNSYFGEFLVKNPLSLLDAPSYQWASELLNKLGRPFELTDFENG